jgi:hypothetical protein
MTENTNLFVPDVPRELNSFAPITLQEMDDVKLLNRVDTKYLLPRGQLPRILDGLTDDYRVLSIDGTRLQTYETLYFDTQDAAMYRMHHNGYACRTKVRKRWYVGSGLAFFEIKRRTNKKRTLKSRTRLPSDEPYAIEAFDSWVDRHCPYKFSSLTPKTWTRFHRITLVNHGLTERVTIDCDISWVSAQPGDHLPPQNAPWSKPEVEFYVLEMKRSGHNVRPVAMDVLRDNRVHQASFSKYCIGTALLNPELKRGLFKPILRNLGTLRT